MLTISSKFCPVFQSWMWCEVSLSQLMYMLFDVTHPLIQGVIFYEIIFLFDYSYSNPGSSTVDKPIVIDISPESSSRGSTFEHFDDRSVSSLGSLESAEFVDAHKAIRRSFAGSKRALDAGCITPPVR